MKSKKLFILLSALALSLAGCSGTNNNGGQSGGDKSASQAQTIAVESVAINKTELTLEVGSSETLTASVLPENASDTSVTWSSSDTSVAEVSALGKVTAKAIGNAVITATSVSNPTVKGECALTVEKVKTAKELYGTVHEGTEADPLTNEDAITVCEHKDVGTKPTALSFYIKGEVDYFTDVPSSYGNVSFTFKPATEGGKRFIAYRVKKGADGAAVTYDDVWKGGQATIYASIYNYNDSIPEVKTGYLVKCEGEKVAPQTKTATVAEALTAIAAMNDNEVSFDNYKVTGYIIKYVSAGTFYMSDTKGPNAAAGGKNFEVMNYAGDNKELCTLNAKVEVECTLKNYVSTTDSAKNQYETGSVKAVKILEEGDDPEIKMDAAPALATVAAGTKYYGSVYQANLNRNLFLNGSISGNYLQATEYASAAKVVLEASGSDFKLKFDGESGKYINLNTSGKAVLGEDANAATLYTWNETAKTLVSKSKIGSGDAAEYYYLGTYGTYNTISSSKLSFLIKDGKVVDGQFPLQFIAEAAAADPTAFQIPSKATVIAGVAAKINVIANPYNADLSKLSWASADDTVATVAAGVVTGKKAGTVKITATFGTGETQLKGECMVTVEEVNMGTKDAPLTIEQAIAASKKVCLNGALSPVKAFVKGVITPEADMFVNTSSGYFGKYSIKDGDKKIYVVNSKTAEGLLGNIYENDEIVVSGFLQIDATNGLQFIKDSNNDYPFVEKLLTVGTSTITVGDHEHATVSELSATSGLNGSTFTFKASADSGYAVSSVKVNNKAVTANEGVYTGKVEGNTVITVEAKLDTEKAVEFTIADVPLFFESSNTSSTEHEFSAGTLDFGIIGAKTCSSATATSKYDYIMLMGGAIYNKTTLAGYYVSNVSVTYTSGTGVSGEISVTFGTAAMTSRDTTTTGTAPEKGGTLSVNNTDTTKSYFNISNKKTNNTQIAKVVVTFTKVPA